MTRLSDEQLGRHLDRRITTAPLAGSEREELVASIAQIASAAPQQRRGFDLFARRLLPAAAGMAAVVVVVALVLQLPRADTLPGTSPAVSTAATAGGVAETGSPPGTAPPEPSATADGAPAPSLVLATPTPDHDAASYAQARAVLDRWEEAVNSAPEGAIAFTSFVSYGGGWRGPNADEQKSAFLSGRIEASVQLPTDEPRPGEVVWEDGSRATVPLISAADAFDELWRGRVGAGCPECRPLEVVGARLITRGAETSRGWANVPAWEFVFTGRDEPTVPISQVAVRDRIDVPPAEDVAPFMGYALGTPGSTALVVAFSGSACGPVHYTAEAIESELGVVVLVQPDPPPQPDATPGICIAMAVGRTAVVELAAPLGNRTVLDPVSAQPIPVYAELPEEGFPRP